MSRGVNIALVWFGIVQYAWSSMLWCGICNCMRMRTGMSVAMRFAWVCVCVCAIGACVRIQWYVLLCTGVGRYDLVCAGACRYVCNAALIVAHM